MSRRLLWLGATPLLLRMQHQDRIIGSHGAGLVTHTSMASVGGNAAAKADSVHRFSHADPAPDLFHTKVHEGLGTSASDPYIRTLSNQESVAPESTVLTAVAPTAMTLNEAATLEQRWEDLQYWIGEQFPRLLEYVRSLCVHPVLPISTKAERLMQQFASRIIPVMMQGEPEEARRRVHAHWARALDDYATTLTPWLLFDRESFETHVHTLHAATLRELQALCHDAEESALALEVLRRRAILRRNEFIEQHLLPHVQPRAHATRQGLSSDAVWRLLFGTIQRSKGELFSGGHTSTDSHKSSSDSSRLGSEDGVQREKNTLAGAQHGVDASDCRLLYAWEAVMSQDVVRTPTLTAPVALYLTLLGVALRDQVTTACTTTASSALSGTRQAHEGTASSDYALVGMTQKRRFVLRTVEHDILRAGLYGGCAALQRAARAAAKDTLARDVALVDAMSDDAALRRVDSAELLERFSSTTEVCTLLTSVVRSNDHAARQHVARVFGLASASSSAPSLSDESGQVGEGSAPRNTSDVRRRRGVTGEQARQKESDDEALASVSWDRVLASLDWANTHKRVAAELLSDTATLMAVHKVVRNALGARSAIQHLFKGDYEQELRRLIRARQERRERYEAMVTGIASTLASYDWVNWSLGVLRELGVNMQPLDDAAASCLTFPRPSSPMSGTDNRVSITALNAPSPHDYYRTATDVGSATTCTVNVGLLEAVLCGGVSRRHESWMRAGVLPRALRARSSTALSAVMLSPSWPLEQQQGTMPVLRDVKDAVRVMVRMMVRLMYVPQAGAAAIAQHTRRRIGPIGLEPHQFNVPTEMGFVEQYDNLQYKRYDWQGWYQRMVDVHNRNVSIRCRIDDLKRLDGEGCPFVDLQTERRLRIVAGDRVGMGVLKLDSDKYEDQSDNVTHGTIKLSEILADARKAQLGLEYWPTVELKVRRPSGQSQAHYSLIDYDRIEKRSKDLYKRYRDAKKRSLFVTPMDLWLEVRGMQARSTASTADKHGYSVDTLQQELTENGNSA